MKDAFKSSLEAMLRHLHGRADVDEIAALIGGDVDRFETAWDIFCNGEPPLPQRMAWVLDVVTEAHPSHAARYAGSIAARLPYLQNSAEQRAATKILTRTILPLEAIGTLAETLFPWLENPQMQTAIRCHAMEILYNISCLEPELKRELALVIAAAMEFGGPGIQSRGKKVLARLSLEIKEIDRLASMED